VDWAWPTRQSSPEQFLKHTLATHLLTLWNQVDHEAKKEAGSAGEGGGSPGTGCSNAWAEHGYPGHVVVELAIIRWTRHHVHIAHHVSLLI
jgi:hypothetical protein